MRDAENELAVVIALVRVVGAKPHHIVSGESGIAGGDRRRLSSRMVGEHGLAILPVRLNERGAGAHRVGESGAAGHIQTIDDAVARPLRADDVTVHLGAHALILAVGTDAQSGNHELHLQNERCLTCMCRVIRM